MKQLKFILAIVLMLLVIIIIVQNHEAMSTTVVFQIDLLSLQMRSNQLTLYTIVIISFLFGVIVSGLYGIIERFQLKKQIRELTRSNKEKDEELNSLRNLPITSDEVPPGQPEAE
jgi:uncharacterized membrane protein YciS (DUF1049 family)